MNIELNNDTVTEGYLQWIEDLEPARPKDYMNLWRSYINDEPLETVYQMSKEPYKYGNSLPPIMTILPGFMNTQKLLYELSKLRHKSFKFNGEVIEEVPTHPWDDLLYDKINHLKAEHVDSTLINRVMCIDSCYLEKRTELHYNVIKSTLETISEITNDSNPDPDDPMNNDVSDLTCLSLWQMNRNKRKYLLKSFWEEANKIKFEKDKSLGEHPHE